MSEFIAQFVVFAASSFLVVLALMAFLLPSKAVKFLDGFASSAQVHFIEMLLRLAVGVSLLTISKSMALSEIFYVFGWVLCITSALLILIPWQYHKKFADLVVPPLTNRVWLFGVLALPLGLVMGWALWVGNS